MADLDYGLIGKALAAAVGAKAIKGKVMAGQMNRYAESLNAGLPFGYQVPDQRRNFFFGDATQYQKALDALAERQYNQYISDYYAQHAGLPAGPLQAVKDFYNTEVGPIRTENAKRQIQGVYGRKELEGLPAALDWVNAMSGEGPAVWGAPAPIQQAPPLNPNEPQLDYSDPALQQGGPLRAGAQYKRMPDLPEYITPETLRSVMSFYNTQRGQNVSMRGQDLTRQTAVERLDEQKRINSARIQNMLDRIGIDRQRLALYAKYLKQRSGRAPSKVEVAQQMLRNGEITKDQFKNFILNVPDWYTLEDSSNGGGFGKPPAGSGGIPSFSDWDSEHD